MQIVVLGAGMVGSAIAIDLSKSLSVTAADINQEALDKLLSFGIGIFLIGLGDGTTVFAVKVIMFYAMAKMRINTFFLKGCNNADWPKRKVFSWEKTFQLT